MNMAGYTQEATGGLVAHGRQMESFAKPHRSQDTSRKIGQQDLNKWVYDWYRRKTTVKKYKFICSYFIDGLKENHLIDNLLKFDSVVDASMPFYDMEAVTTVYGNIPQTFMKYKPENRTIKVTYDENALGTVGLAIQLLQKSVSWMDGCVVPPSMQSMGDVHLDIYDDSGTIIYKYIGRNIKYGGTETQTLSYSDKDVMRYSINWVCDTIDFIYDPTNQVADNLGAYDVDNSKFGMDYLGQIAKLY